MSSFDYWLYLKKKFIKLYPLLLLVVFVCTLGVFFLEKGLGETVLQATRAEPRGAEEAKEK